MKKTITLFLALALTLSLASCGGGSEDVAESTDSNTPTEEQTEASIESQEEEEATLPTKEELLEIATEVTAKEILTDYKSNVVSATMTYSGQTYLLHGYIGGIGLDKIWLRYEQGNVVYIPLSLMEIAALEEGQYVAVVATLEEIELENTEATSLSSSPTASYGYVVSTSVEVTGTTGNFTSFSSEPDTWYLRIFSDEQPIEWDIGQYYNSDIYVTVDTETKEELFEQIKNGADTIHVIADLNTSKSTTKYDENGWILINPTVLEVY